MLTKSITQQLETDNEKEKPNIRHALCASSYIFIDFVCLHNRLSMTLLVGKNCITCQTITLATLTDCSPECSICGLRRVRTKKVRDAKLERMKRVRRQSNCKIIG